MNFKLNNSNNQLKPILVIFWSSFPIHHLAISHTNTIKDVEFVPNRKNFKRIMNIGIWSLVPIIIHRNRSNYCNVSNIHIWRMLNFT